MMMTYTIPIGIGSVALNFDSGPQNFLMADIISLARLRCKHSCAIVGMLSNYPHTKNRFYYIADGIATLEQFVTMLGRGDPSGRTQP